MSSAVLDRRINRQPLNLPAIISQPLNYIPTKWTDVRQDKVELMRDRFKKDPATVLVLKDTKFDDEHLAVLKKSVLEDLVKLNADLQSGEAAIKESMEGMITAVNTLIEALRTDKNLLESNRLVKSAIQTVRVQIRAVVKTSVIYTSPPEDKVAANLSEEENVRFEELIADEED